MDSCDSNNRYSVELLNVDRVTQERQVNKDLQEFQVKG